MVEYEAIAMGGKVKTVCTKAGYELWIYGSAKHAGWAVYRIKTDTVIINGALAPVLQKWFELTT